MMRRIKPFLCTLLLLSSICSAQNGTLEEGDPNYKPSEGRSIVAQYIHGIVNHCDKALCRLFLLDHLVSIDEQVEKYILEEIAESYIRISPDLEWREGEGFDPGLKVKAKLEFARFSRVVDIRFDNFDDDLEVFEEEGYRLYQQELLKDVAEKEGHDRFKPGFKTSTGLSLRFSGGIKPEFVTKFKLHYHHTESLHFDIYEKLFWDWDEGFGSRTSFNTHYHDPHGWLIDLSVNALISEETDGFKVGQGISIAKEDGNGLLLGLQASYEQRAHPSFAQEFRNVNLLYRKPIHKDLLYLQITPGVDFEEENNFEANKYFIVRFDVYLGLL